MVVLAGVANPRAYASGDARETRSPGVLHVLVPSQDGPGCAAAVGVRGSVVREAERGNADLTTGCAVASKPVFDMASNSERFTADAVLLPAGRHQLALNEPLSDDLDNPPDWARDISLGDLMRRASGIPDYQDPLEAKGIELTGPAGQDEAIAAILAAQPQDPPGEGFSYSNSNCVLLAHVVERVTGKQYGDGSVRTTPGELVRWADDDRTVRIGGTELLAGVTDGAVSVGDVLRPRGIEERRRGAGILPLPDRSLVHRGDWEGFHSTVRVSPDRKTAVTVVCNAEPPDNFRVANQLLDIWTK
ncbi:serine hydrolase domain-containing protein [Streptomyces sp. NPDC005046]